MRKFCGERNRRVCEQGGRFDRVRGPRSVHGGEIASTSACRVHAVRRAAGNGKHRGEPGSTFPRWFSQRRNATWVAAAWVLRSFASNAQPIERLPLTQGVTARASPGAERRGGDERDGFRH